MHDAAPISDLLQLLVDSLREVRGAEADSLTLAELKETGYLVYRAMTQRTRCYHDLAHLFAVAREVPALARLAVIYHDVVYLSVDVGMAQEISDQFGDVMVCSEGRVYLTADPDELLSGVATVFGFSAGQELPQEGGLNEFLSAVLAVRELRFYLGDHDLWAIAACIEATIPFRGMVDGKSPDDLLGDRLRALSMPSEKIESIQVLAVKVANADLQSFGKSDFKQFIDNTWEILAETNRDFQEAGEYSIRTYREALCRMERFFCDLDPHVIWRRHGNVPDEEAYRSLIASSRFKVRSAVAYINAYIVALSLVEAVAELTGGDGPISYFVSDAGNEASESIAAWHGLGRRFDLALLPLVVSVYKILRRDGVAELRPCVYEVHAGHRDWRWFLDSVPKDALRHVGRVMAQSAVTRRERIDELVR
jgi:hypothetical protein